MQRVRMQHDKSVVHLPGMRPNNALRGEKRMKNRRRRGTTILWIGLMLLFATLNMLLLAEVDSDMSVEQIEKGGAE